MLISSALWPLLFWLSTYWLTTQATEPNCVHVPDFDNCPGDVLDFCPTGVTCGCKDQRPFCKCPSYQSGWQSYWYLGTKCDQLWSTLDLIIVTVLPAIALSMTIAVAMQWVNYCKSKQGDGVRRHRTPAKEQRPKGQHNTAYVPNPADKDDGISQNYKFPKLSYQRPHYEEEKSPRIGGFSYTPHQPLRRAAPMRSNAFVSPPPQNDQYVYMDSEIPNADYEEENPFTAMAMQKLQTPGSSLFPRPDYYERNSQPSNYQSGLRNPFSIGRPQINYA